MSNNQADKLQPNDYIVKFGIQNGLAVVRGVHIATLMQMEPQRFCQIFQPEHAKIFRTFALESIVNGHITDVGRNILHDVMDLVELSMPISHLQHVKDESPENLIRNIKSQLKFRSAGTEKIAEILFDMFRNKEIGVSITHPTQFSRYFGVTHQDNITTMADAVYNNLDLVKLITHIRLGQTDNDPKSVFVNTIFPSIVRAYNTSENYGRHLRGMRELKMHKRMLETNKALSIVDVIALRRLLDKVIEDNK